MKRMVQSQLALLGSLLVFLCAFQLTFAQKGEINYQPGRLLILTENEYTPTLSSLLPDIPFSNLKSYADFKIESLATKYPLNFSSEKSGAKSLLDNLYLLSFPDTTDIFSVMSRIKDNPGIKYIEPDYKVEVFNWPTDSLFSNQWYLHNTGQGYYAIERKPGDNNDSLYIAHGLSGEDIHISPIYDNTPADATEIIVGIIDTGVDYDHPDLAGHIFTNSGEIPDNKIDDDHNGLIDDYRGWDFSGNSASDFGGVGDSDPMDDNVGHGTHVAGLIAAVQNEIGIAGYPGNIKILPVKIFPRAFQSVTVPAILYAVNMGAKVINLSWGSPFEMDILHEALKYARQQGCLPVAAIGNFGNSLPMAPASFEETFTVGGTNSDGYMTYFSSYGPVIDISAPARDILSLRAANTDLYGDTEPGLRIIADKYIIADGTSMASPIVAGAAAMLWSFNPSLTPERIIDALEQSADDITDPWNEGDNLPGYDTLSGWGRLDVGAAFGLLQAPSAYITSPAHMQTVSGRIVVGVATTGGYNGPAKLYVGEGKTPDTWTLLFETAHITDNPIFYEWNSDGQYGYFSFRLECDAGSNQVDFRLVNGQEVRITLPENGDTVLYKVDIDGTAFGDGYDSVVVSYRQDGQTEKTRIYSGPAVYFDEYITDWPVMNMDGGYCRVFLDGYGSFGVRTDSVQVFINQTMREGFPKTLPDFIGFSPGVADINGDGFKEIVVGCQRGVYAYTCDGSLLPGFPVLTNVDMRSIPAVDDIDGDGLADIIMSGDSVIVCLNYLGEELNGWPTGASTGMTYYAYPTPVPTELYESSDSVVLYMSRLGEIHAYKFNGDSYFYSLAGLFTALDPNIFDTSNSSGLGVPFVTATDLEPDGNLDVVAVYGTALDESGIYIWNARNGLPPDGWETPQARNILRVSGGTLADVDNNGSLEIITTGQDSINQMPAIWVTENGRQDLPGWPVYLPAVSGWIGTSPVCVDLDGDGHKEILVAYYNWDFTHIYAFHGDGTPYRETPVYLPNGLLATAQTTLSHLIVADIDGNGTVNIIGRGGHLLPFAKGYELIHVWEPDGTPTPGFPIVTPTPPLKVFSTPNTPIVDDLDSDGKVDVLLCSDWNELYVWSLDYLYNPDLMPWPKYMGDSKNSGINHHRGMPTDVDDGQPPTAYLFGISKNYPNPFNPTTTIQFSLQRKADVRLDIFNILGQKVKTIVTGTYEAGNHNVIWNGTDNRGDDVASGVYFARLVSDGRQSTKKMVLVR